ncbi:MAG: winged helix-turn-helix domain-containing protein [Candidatus Acidiferrales bacterium]
MGVKLPTFDQLMNPLLRSLRALGGSGSVDEIYDKVVELERLPDEIVSQAHDPEKSNQTEVAYRLAWARTYLKKFGLLENSSRGIWSLTGNAKNLETVDPQEVVRTVRALVEKDTEIKGTETALPIEVTQEQEWKQKLHAILTQKLSPAAFERLVQRCAAAS